MESNQDIKIGNLKEDYHNIIKLRRLHAKPPRTAKTLRNAFAAFVKPKKNHFARECKINCVKS